MDISRRVVLAAIAVIVASSASPARAEPAGSWSWPALGPVIRAFDPPETPYGSGHRGIDIAAPAGTRILAPTAGTVKFSGPVGGELFLSIDHGGGFESTYSWIGELGVRKGDAVFERQDIGRTGSGHPGGPVPHLHFGVKRDGAYVDPLSVLAPGSVAGFLRLVPLAPASAALP
jgi:murein DD-endopeptidase MepM/ murein hydrolase activator NlpD